ncbi:ABC transporter ATP-binding protein [Methylobacillus sp.]|uniref:ABC transporter ATP-binding protein n=1 Tax=Methylobacillus sp. TaxID=56818 RepID=UPI0012BEC666|nr:ABC transporter ATP-binding protein [Methylobacillus sp.]MPS48002.1 ABC transporter ATP-binding protein [Methylobacillus sp.]
MNMKKNHHVIPNRAIPFLFHYVRIRPWLFGSVFLVIIIAASCAVGVQYAMKMLIDAMDGHEPRVTANVWMPLAVFLALITLENIMWRIGGVQGSRAIVASGVDLRLDLFVHLTGHSMRYFNQHFSGSLGNRVTATAAATGELFGTIFWRILPPITDFLGAVLVLTTIRWPMGIGLVLSVLLVAGVLILFGVRGRKIHYDYAQRASSASGEMVDVVSNVWTVKAFAASLREKRRLAKELNKEASAHRRSWMHIEMARVIHDLCLVITAGIMLYWAIMLWRSNTISTGDVVIVSALTFRILHGSRDLALALVGTAQQFGVINETLRVIASPHTVQDPDRPAQLQVERGIIKLDNISYAYPNGNKVFEGLSLEIKAGERVGLVGASGSGKSTLISLIQRLDDVKKGRILIDGQPIDMVSQDSLRERIAVVPQDIALFNRSVFENIRYGRPDAKAMEVYAAARNAYCDEFIRALPKGYHTVVGERGVSLSGGQRQRLGIARAFLKDAPILILDEATSALDTQSEKEIQAALADLMRGRTVLAIAHRLSTLASFDRIIVLENGKIIEDGHPEALRNQGGVFAQMWKLQAESFEN